MSEEDPDKITITFPIPVRLDRIVIEVVKATIGYYKGDKRAAAKSLGISLKTVYNKLERENARVK